MGFSGSPVPPEKAVPSSSFAQRLVGVFISPGSAFAEISRRPDFLPPLILLVLLSLATAEAVLAKIGMERIIRAAIEQSRRASSMSAEQMQQAIEQGSRFGVIIGHASGLLAVPVILLIIAGLGLLIVSGIFGGELNFKKVFSVSAYAYLPTTLRSLMTLSLVFFGDPDRFNPRTPAPSSIGFFLNPLETSRPLFFSPANWTFSPSGSWPSSPSDFPRPRAERLSRFGSSSAIWACGWSGCWARPPWPPCPDLVGPACSLTFGRSGRGLMRRVVCLSRPFGCV